MMALRISFPISILFSGWGTSAEHYWITSRERSEVGISIV